MDYETLPDLWENAETLKIAVWIESNTKVKDDIETLVHLTTHERHDLGTADAIEKYVRENFPSDANWDQLADFYIVI